MNKEVAYKELLCTGILLRGIEKNSKIYARTLREYPRKGYLGRGDLPHAWDSELIAEDVVIAH